ncbi:MAG: rhomboid family intramembrane serine protease [Planctomycetes bacterium]|nr:rhomboid family intramembrane serine protease [Planctomycetota bacterium]
MSYDGPRLPTLTPAIKQLLILNAIVFAANALLLGRLSSQVDGGGHWFAFSWSLGLDGYGLGLLRLVSYQFTHSFADPWHFLGNMMVLFFMGTIAEPRLGYRGTLKLYLVGGAAGALLHLGLASIQGYADVPLVGASGACYAFLVYAACRMPNAMVFNILPLWILAAVLVFIGAYSMFVEFAAGYGSGVSHSAHLGGAAVGFVAFRRSWFIDWADQAGHARPGLLASMLDGYRKRQARARAASAARQEHQLDDLLAKVKRDGIGSLTQPERRFLEKVSKQKQD